MINMDSENNPLRKMQASLVPATTADIGSTLRKAREKRGHSLELVSQQTRISKRYLEAMESNRLEELPALAYLRSFLKSYCDYLEIDFEPLWSTVLAERNLKTPASPGEPSPAPSTPAPNSAKHETHSDSDKSVLFAALFAAAALVVLVLIWSSTRSEKTAPPADTTAPPAALQPVSPPLELNLEIYYRQEVWLRLAADGQVKFEGRVPANTRQHWKAKKSMTLNSSNTAGLALTLNGSPYTLPAPDSSGSHLIEFSAPRVANAAPGEAATHVSDKAPEDNPPGEDEPTH